MPPGEILLRQEKLLALARLWQVAPVSAKLLRAHQHVGLVDLLHLPHDEPSLVLRERVRPLRLRFARQKR